MKRIILAVVVLLAMATAAQAGNNGKPCTFDVECYPGHCVKSMGSMSGVCAGGYDLDSLLGEEQNETK